MLQKNLYFSFWSNAKVLLFGRVLSGIAVAILSSAFETWFVLFFLPPLPRCPPRYNSQNELDPRYHLLSNRRVMNRSENAAFPWTWIQVIVSSIEKAFNLCVCVFQFSGLFLTSLSANVIFLKKTFALQAMGTGAVAIGAGVLAEVYIPGCILLRIVYNSAHFDVPTCGHILSQVHILLKGAEEMFGFVAPFLLAFGFLVIGSLWIANSWVEPLSNRFTTGSLSQAWASLARYGGSVRDYCDYFEFTSSN